MDMDLNAEEKEEGELEDGEIICDDDTEEREPVSALQPGALRPSSLNNTRNTRKSTKKSKSKQTGTRCCPLPPPLMVHQHPPDFRLLLMPHNRGGPPPPHLPFPGPPFPPPGCHRQQGGPPPGPHCDPQSPGSSFWERSHTALGRFRHRGKQGGEGHQGGDWGGRSGGWGGGGGGREAGGGRPPLPPCRYGPPGENHIHSNIKESPTRKQKLSGRNLVRKQVHNVAKAENGVDESFEDLLDKYKQIQLKLECIRKEETMALKPKDDLTQKETEVSASIPATDPAAQTNSMMNEANVEEWPEKVEVKVFQAFNLKPLRQKLLTPAERDALKLSNDPENEESGNESEKAACVDPSAIPKGGGEEKEEKEEVKVSCVCCSESEDSPSSPSPIKTKMKLKGKGDEDEEMSELQLRLLALQSASRKWQQKEQQVMKESKEKITKAKPAAQERNNANANLGLEQRSRVTTRSASYAAAEKAKAANAKPLEKAKAGAKPLVEKGKAPVNKAHPVRKTISPGSATKQEFRKQQVRQWKLQQQREREEARRQEEREREEARRQEEEERRKREDEIRKIRDLSNQDEQYNRFMKLVGGKAPHPPRSKSRDSEHRKSTGKQGLDTSGNLYQYDNYDEVAMDTDSETNSPACSPAHDPFAPEVPQFFSQMPPFPLDSPQYNNIVDLGQRFLTEILTTVAPPPLPPMPPPDTPEQPPKPPFADEEEEEEMLLRETCLMSMTTKKPEEPVTEEETNSGPPTSSPMAPAGVQPLPRGNLSLVSLNTVPPTRSNKFTRLHHVPRPPLVLPRHKSVVVKLNDSDDSDSSDMEASSSTNPVFGGLEFMIKEARRTAEAAKHKVASGSEKENNPVRTPETLPEAKKTEYRLLLEEIASREKHKMLVDLSVSRGCSPQRVASPAGSDSDVDTAAKAAAILHMNEAEGLLTKHRNLLQKDEAILRLLLQQEVKKKESLKAADSKMSRLKEQLLASEKIVSANKTLLKKLQEQVHRVEHRVSVTRTVVLKLEKDLTQAQAAAGRGQTVKRRAPHDPIHHLPGKLQRVQGPRGADHFAELIAQKQRLQQLEAEYALKIQKLKEAHANRVVVLEAPLQTSTPSRPSQAAELPPSPPPPSSPFPLPQPSLHDLTQDKLTLESEGGATEANEENDLLEPTTPSDRGTRRRSYRESGSFTKPKLELVGASGLVGKEGAAAKPVKAAVPLGPAELVLGLGKEGAAKPVNPAELVLGLDLEALKQKYDKQPRLGELLLGQLRVIGCTVEKGLAGKVIPDMELLSAQAHRADLKPAPFGPYRSPLLVFKSYRFSPYFRTKEKLSISSVSYSNVVEPRKCFCRFDLTGTCNDDECRWQHMRNCTFSGNQLFQDILSYNLPLIASSDSSTTDDVSVATEKYMKSVFGANKDRMGMDQKAVLLVSKVNESKRHVPPFTTCKEIRRWRPQPSLQASPSTGDDSGDENLDYNPGLVKYDGVTKTSLFALDVCVTTDDKRYFVSETDDISNLETSVLESPRDAQLWIKLAFRYLSQKEITASECLDAALNTLSRALEDNRGNAEIWCHYLQLFVRRGKREEVQEMYETAVEHAPDYLVWWSYLTMESSFEGKDYVCGRLLQYLLLRAGGALTDRLSFQLLEALLYRVQLSLFTGRLQNALAILQNALKSANERSIADHLTVPDRALAWLSYIHLTEFDRLPASLFDPASSSPARVVSREPFLLPWRTPQDIRTPPDTLIALFEDAICRCTDESLPAAERTLACQPLHTNLITLNGLLERYEVGMELCESLLVLCPYSCTLLGALADLCLQKGEGEQAQAVSVWLRAVSECPHNAEVFYHYCKFMMTQEKSSSIAPVFQEFVLSFCEDQHSELQPVDVLQYILGMPTENILKRPSIKKQLQEQLSHQMPYLNLVHCCWQWVYGTVGEAMDAFERALGAVMQLDVLYKLWMDYLLFTSRRLVGSQANSRELRMFADLVQRCLATVPSRLEVPFSSAQYWSSFQFHNKVLSLYLSCLPQSQHPLVLERLRYTMPTNATLALRLLHQEWQDGNIEHLKFQARMLSSSIPNCLANWKIAIAVERELKQRSEVRLLYQQALRKLPLCAALWKDRLLFEAAEGGKTDKLRKLVDRCQELGVSLTEPLNLGSSKTTEAEVQ